MEYAAELHTLRNCWTAIVGGIETGKLELAVEALKRAEEVLTGLVNPSSDPEPHQDPQATPRIL